jgi:TonB family protein
MHKERKDKNFIKKPIYEGGPRAMKAFIAKNLTYPDEALQHKIEGTVVVHYDIDHQGKVTDAKVLSGLGYGCDEEAIRLVKLLTFTVPKNRGVKVLFHKNMQIHFRLPKAKPQQTGQITYTYQPKKKEPSTETTAPKKSYGYTIQF